MAGLAPVRLLHRVRWYDLLVAIGAMAWSVLAMTIMILAVDQLLWRPVVTWAQKFRVEEGGSSEKMTSWFLSWLRRSRMLGLLAGRLARLASRWSGQRSPKPVVTARAPAPAWLNRVPTALLIVILAYGAWRLFGIVRDVTGNEWLRLVYGAGLTLGRVLLSTIIGTLWTVPAGLAIGLSPRFSRALQPVVQVVASFPSPMLFPIVLAVLAWAGVSPGWGSIALMLLGAQWYILFNVIAGAMAIPADLREAAASFRLSLFRRTWNLYLPAIFPFLVTGWVTAAGGERSSYACRKRTTRGRSRHSSPGANLASCLSMTRARECCQRREKVWTDAGFAV